MCCLAHKPSYFDFELCMQLISRAERAVNKSNQFTYIHQQCKNYESKFTKEILFISLLAKKCNTSSSDIEDEVNSFTGSVCMDVTYFNREFNNNPLCGEMSRYHGRNFMERLTMGVIYCVVF